MLIIIILGKQSQEFLENLGTLVINYLLPKLLVTYGSIEYVREFLCQNIAVAGLKEHPLKNKK